MHTRALVVFSIPSPPDGGNTIPSPPDGGSTIPSPPNGGSTIPSPPNGGSTIPSPPNGGSTIPSPPNGGSLRPRSLPFTWKIKRSFFAFISSFHGVRVVGLLAVALSFCALSLGWVVWLALSAHTTLITSFSGKLLLHNTHYNTRPSGKGFALVI